MRSARAAAALVLLVMTGAVGPARVGARADVAVDVARVRAGDAGRGDNAARQSVTSVVVDNAWAMVSRDAAPCATASARCVDRVVVALGPIEIESAGTSRALVRGEIAAFGRDQSYAITKRGAFVEVVLKPDRPRTESPAEIIPPDKNEVVHDAPGFFVFEERLAPGDTRARHSHSQRVVIQLNRTRLEQWPDGEPMLVREIHDNGIGFNPPVIHVVKNVGDLPLRGVVIELKP